MINYCLDESTGVVCALLTSDVSWEEQSDFYKELAQDYMYLPVLRLLQNEMQASFPETDRMIEQSRELIRILTDRFARVKLAVVQTRPVETAYSFMFFDHFDGVKIDCQVFSTEENAAAWLAK